MFSGKEGKGGRHLAPPAPDDGNAELLPRVRPERHRLVFALVTTLAALPIIVLDNIPANADSPDQHVRTSEVEAAAAPETTTSTTAVAPETTTTAPPETTSTTAAPAATTTTAAPRKAAPTTTTTRPAPKPTTTTAPPPPANQQEGPASWYDHQAGGCAHRTLPMGTQVRVTNLANGKVATCVVNDRGPYTGGRIIDLDRTVFSQLAPTSAGVVNVRINW